MKLEPKEHGPVNRLMLARYLVCSDDPNPIHVDEPFARSLGFPTVVAQGMLSFGWIAEALVDTFGHDRVRSLSARFAAPVFPGESVTVGGESLRIWQESEGTFAELDVFAVVAGERRLSGRAIVAVEPPSGTEG